MYVGNKIQKCSPTAFVSCLLMSDGNQTYGFFLKQKIKKNSVKSLMVLSHGDSAVEIKSKPSERESNEK